MGLRTYLARRRERESAINPAEVEALRAPVGDADAETLVGCESLPCEPASDQYPSALDLPGAGPGELARMLTAALAGGTPQISAAHHRIEGPEQLNEELVGLLAGFGSQVQAEGHAGRIEVDPDQAPALLERLRARIAELEAEAADRPPPAA